MDFCTGYHFYNIQANYVGVYLTGGYQWDQLIPSHIGFFVSDVWNNTYSSDVGSRHYYHLKDTDWTVVRFGGDDKGQSGGVTEKGPRLCGIFMCQSVGNGTSAAVGSQTDITLRYRESH